MTNELHIVLYTEGCNATRHYSLICAQVRNLTIVQGLVVLGAAGYLTNEGLLIYSIGMIIFGLLLTGTLWSMHDNYYKHFGKILGSTVALETMILKEDQVSGVWETYNAARESRTNRMGRKNVLHYGTFVLLLISFLILLSHNMIKYIA